MCKINSIEDYEGIGVTRDMKRAIEASRKNFGTSYSMSQSIDSREKEVLQGFQNIVFCIGTEETGKSCFSNPKILKYRYCNNYRKMHKAPMHRRKQLEKTH